MKLEASKPRSKVLFGICHLQNKDDLPYPSNIARVTDQDSSNISKYCSDWHDAGLLYKETEEGKATYEVQRRPLVAHYFEHVSEEIKDELGQGSLSDEWDKVSDVSEVIDDEGGGMFSQFGNKGIEVVQPKLEMIQYFWNKQYDENGQLVHHVGDQLIHELSLPLTQKSNFEDNMYQVISNLVGSERAQIIDEAIKVSMAFEKHYSDVETVNDAYHVFTEQLLLRTGRQHFEGEPEDMADEVREFYRHLYRFKTSTLS